MNMRTPKPEGQAETLQGPPSSPLPREGRIGRERTDMPRRTVLFGAAQALGAATIGGVAVMSRPQSAAAQVGAEPPHVILSVPSVKRLRDVAGREALAFAQGLKAPDDGGGGVFVWRASATEHVPDDGFVNVASGIGEHGCWTRLDYAGAAVRPEWFGSLAYELDHAVIIQRAVDHVSAGGGGQVELGSRVYPCLSVIEIDPTLCSLSACGAVLDFSERQESGTAGSGNEVVLGDLLDAAVGPWSDEAGILHRQGYDEQKLAVRCDLPAGERCRAEIDLVALQGDPNNPFLRIEIFRAEDAHLLAELVLSSAGRVAFEFDAPESPCEIVLSSNSEVDIADFRLAPTGRRECLLVRCRESGTQYGHRWIEGLRLYGPGRSGRANDFEGIRFETTIEARASRLAMRDVIIEGFGTAVVMSHRCYLAHFSSCRFVSRVGVHFLAGSDDAGENISFVGCAIGGGEIGIWNGGAELNLFGSSVNFCEHFYVGNGNLHASGCHFETNRTLRSDQYLFDIGKGLVNIEGGTILVSGREFEAGNQADYIVMCRSRLAKFSLARAACYNLRTASDTFAGGLGSVRLTEIAGDARKFIAPIPKRDMASNLFGPTSLFDGATDLPALIVGPGDRDDLAVLGRLEETGEGVLSITKKASAGTETWCWLVARCLPGMRLAWSLDMRHAPATSGTFSSQDGVLLDVLFCQLGRPEGISGFPGPFVAAKRPLLVPFGDLKDWAQFVGSTHDTREDEWGDGSAPAFATEIALRIDLRNLAPGDKLLLRAPYAAMV